MSDDLVAQDGALGRDMSAVLSYALKDLGRDMGEIKGSVGALAKAHADQTTMLTRLDERQGQLATRLELQPVAGRADAAHRRLDEQREILDRHTQKLEALDGYWLAALAQQATTQRLVKVGFTVASLVFAGLGLLVTILHG